MKMMLVIGLLAICAFLYGLFAYYYRLYKQSPAVRWCDRIQKRHHQIANALAEWRAHPVYLWDDRSRRNELFRQLLRKHSINQLDSVPGIGPGTITTLKQAGLSSYADLINYRFESLPGIGPAKAKLLTTATTQFIQECDEKFKKQQCPEAVTFFQEAEAAKAREALEIAERQRCIDVLETALYEDRERIALTRQYSFLAYLFDAKTVQIDEQRDQNLPTLDDILATVPIVKPTVATPIVTPVQAIPVAQRVTPPVATPLPTAPIAPQPQPASPPAVTPVLPAPVMPAVPTTSVFGDLPAPARPAVPVVAAAQAAPMVSPKRNRTWGNLFVTPDAPTVAPQPVPPAPLPTPLLPEPVSPPVPAAQQPASVLDVHPLLAELKAFAALGMLIARADGKIAAAERAEVRRFLASQYEHDPRLVRQIDPAIEQAEKARTASDLVCMALLKVCTDPAKRTLAYNFAVRVADASSARSAKELALLKRLEDTFKLTAPKAEAAVVPVQPPTTTAPVWDVPTPANRKPDPVPSAVASPALLETPTPAKPSIPAQVLAKPDEPLNIRDNALLDDVFQDQPAPSPVTPVPPPVSGSADLRQNDLLDDVFGG